MLLLHIAWYLQKSLFSELSQLIAERPDASLEAEVSPESKQWTSL